MSQPVADVNVAIVVIVVACISQWRMSSAPRETKLDTVDPIARNTLTEGEKSKGKKPTLASPASVRLGKTPRMSGEAKPRVQERERQRELLHTSENTQRELHLRGMLGFPRHKTIRNECNACKTCQRQTTRFALMEGNNFWAPVALENAPPYTHVHHYFFQERSSNYFSISET